MHKGQGLDGERLINSFSLYLSLQHYSLPIKPYAFKNYFRSAFTCAGDM